MTVTDRLVAGGLAGVADAALTMPIEAAKTRMQVSVCKRCMLHDVHVTGNMTMRACGILLHTDYVILPHMPRACRMRVACVLCAIRMHAAAAARAIPVAQQDRHRRAAVRLRCVLH